MKTTLSTICAIIITAIIIILLNLVGVYVCSSPKIAILIIALLLFLPFGVGLRSMVEVGIMTLMCKIVKYNAKSFVLCPIVFVLGLLVAITIPWLRGISGWGVWQWIASIAFAYFNFETFLSFVLSSKNIYKNIK